MPGRKYGRYCDYGYSDAGMSGIELAETIVRRGYPCKIVFLTGYDDFSYIHSAFQVNAVDYLLKPFTIEEVEACLKK